ALDLCVSVAASRPLSSLRTIQVRLRTWGPRAGILDAAGLPAVSWSAAVADESRLSYCEITGIVRRDGATDGTGSDATAGFHHAPRRRGGGVAAGGARAAASEAADRRVHGLGHACNPRPMGGRFCAAATGTRLDRRPKRQDRGSLGGRA